MLAKQILGAALFGSLAQAAFPTCISSCVRQNGCPPTDMDCICEKVGKTFLSDVVVCMNQWCSSQTTLGDLVSPISAKCDVPKSAIQAAAAKAGFDTGDIGSTPSAPSSSSSSKGGNSVSVTMGVGSPTKVDSPTPEPTASGSSSKGGNGDSSLSAVLSDTTAVLTQTPAASGTLLVAPSSTFSSVPTSAPTGASASATNSEDSSEESSNGTPGGSPADGAPKGNDATTREASMLAAVLAFGGAMAFGW
ncbi:hypothetical protein GGS26DRAFT_596843 [Hypomontagnella submonticulosa]|nr:hypothetical protein GGS26DRAFT_596843 [Hypomontagnella submonticulosa]